MRATTATLTLAATMALSGCFTSTIKTAIEPLKGQHADALIQRWGYPDQDKTVAGHHILVWDGAGCQRSAEIDDAGVVQHVSVRGAPDFCAEAVR